MIGFAGLSHLGLVTSISIASKGFEVVGFDSDQDLIAILKAARLPFYEPHLSELLARSKSQVHFTSSPAALGRCDVVYAAIDVKTNEDNLSDLAPLQALIERVVPHLNHGTSLVVHSQVPPGFTRALQRQLARREIQVYYQAETLIIGRAVERALRPERYVVGCEEVAANLPPPYASLLGAFECPLLQVRYESAELCKISINMYLISSVSVTNMLSEVCAKVGADWSEIAPALRLDRRIGPHAYLSPGLGLSGGNLERDLSTIRQIGQELGVDVGLAEAFQRDSMYRRDWVVRTIYSQLLAKVPSPVIAVWGLAYKPNTNSVKNSPAIRLVEQLEGISIRAYDPEVELGTRCGWVTQVGSALEACEGAHALVVMTPWDEFNRIPVSSIVEKLREPLLIDPFGLFASKLKEPRSAARYFRLGVEPMVAGG